MTDFREKFRASAENDERLETLTYVSSSEICPRPQSKRKQTERGLFAKDFIKAGTLIGTYTGNALTTREFWNGADVPHTYIKWLNEADPNDPVFKEITDAKTEEKITLQNRIGVDGTSLLKFANHSRNEANMSTQEIFFYAARDIDAGEELTWCYGDYDFEPKKPMLKMPQWVKRLLGNYPEPTQEIGI